jgi:hypothetical protein
MPTEVTLESTAGSHYALSTARKHHEMGGILYDSFEVLLLSHFAFHHWSKSG